MYESDYNSYIMPGVVGEAPYHLWSPQITMKHTWPALVDRYVKMVNRNSDTFDLRGIYTCPSRIYSQHKTGSRAGKEISGDIRRCYGYNQWYLGGFVGSTASGYWKYHKASEIAKASKTVRLIEMWNFDDGSVNSAMAGLYTKGRGTMYAYPPTNASYTVPWYCWPPGWHGGLSGVCWADGHVTMESTYPPTPPPMEHPTGNAPYYGVMSKTLNGISDPFFRIANPKP